MIRDAQQPRSQPASFLWLYAIAWAGGAVAYVPFLTILLPVRLALIAGDRNVEWLAYITFFGALAASIGGVLFGWLSDRSGRRKPWIVGGLIGCVALLMLVPLMTTPLELLLLIVAWQLALNMMLAPLAAWAADHVPRHQLGRLGGLLAFSPALGSVAGAIVTIRGWAGPDERLALVALMVVLCVTPALLLARPAATDDQSDARGDERDAPDRRQALVMWLARFLVQISEAALFAYLYYYFHAIDPARDAAAIARLFSAVLTIGIPLAMLLGRMADQLERPMMPLVLTSGMAGVGLLLMALARTPGEATIAYALFGLATTIFLSLHSAQTLRVLPEPRRRGLYLGLFNLTNTAPSLIMPWLTVSMVPAFGFAGLFVLLGALAFLASGLLLVLARVRSA